MTRPWETVASETTREGVLELRKRSDTEFLITIGGRVLMTSAAHRSEDALARLACEGLRAKSRARVLVSGLGMGFTLRAALSELGPSARVHVAELNGVVVDWCKGPLAPLTKSAALDPRVELEVVDVMALLKRVAKSPDAPRFDAIVLDMYEGPKTHVRENDPLYGPFAARTAKAALTSEGVLAVWCEGASPSYERSLRAAGFEVELRREGRGGSVHMVYVARTRKLEPVLEPRRRAKR